MDKTALFSRQPSGGVVAIEDLALTTGNRYFVSSTQTNGLDAVGLGFGPDKPFKTLDFAISQCTADQGDVIFVMPGHVESSSVASTEIFDLNIAGVSVIGLGEGTLRPTFTLAEATVTCVMGAAGCSISNLRFIGNITDLVAILEIEATADGCTVEDCYFADSASNKDALLMISVAADADRLVIQRNHFNGVVGGEATDCILFAGGSDGTVIRDNIFTGDWKTNGAIGATAALSKGLVIYNNMVSNADGAAGLCIKLNGSTTGVIAFNALAATKNNTESVSTTTLVHIIENYMTDVAAAAAIISATKTVW